MDAEQAYEAAWKYLVRLEKAREADFETRRKELRKEVNANHQTAIREAERALREARDILDLTRVKEAQAELATLPAGLLEEWAHGRPTGRRGYYEVVTPASRFAMYLARSNMRPKVGTIIIRILRTNGKPALTYIGKEWRNEGLVFAVDWRPLHVEEGDGGSQGAG